MQAARGTSLSEVARGSRRSTPRRGLSAAFLLTALVLYAADQVTKAIVVAHLTEGRPRDLVGHLLELSLTRNPGAAFSTGTSYTVVLSVVAIVAVVVVLVVATRALTTFWSIALGVLMAGIAGNLTDRLLRDPSPLHGHVVDFLRLPHWPIFNVADMCINVAAVMILLQAFRGVRLDGSRVGAKPTHTAAESAPESAAGPDAAPKDTSA